MISKLIGLLLVVASLAVVYLFETMSFGSGIWKLLHWPAMVLTGIGPCGLILVCCDWKVVSSAMSLIFKGSYNAAYRHFMREGRVLQRVQELFYSQGAKAFDDLQVTDVSPTCERVFNRLSVRTPVSEIRELVETERDRRRSRLIQGLHVMALGVKLAPSMGMLGTILGMVRLLSTLQDPAEIGSHMSLALLTTFYGLFFSLILWTPMQQKLERLMDIELDCFDQLIHWLDCLERRKGVEYFCDSFDIPFTAPKPVSQAS